MRQPQTLGPLGKLLVAALIAIFTLSACSYTSGLLPVEGTDPNVYFAQANVLTDQKVQILELPDCSLDSDGTTQTCKGTTVDQEPIVVTADQSKEELPMEITVGGKQIFQGSAREVMAEAAAQK